MSFVVIIGCDGAGKSTVLDGLIDHIEADGIEVSCGHWRPAPLSNRSGDHHAATADDPHGQVARGALGSVAKLGWIWINWWLGWFLDLRGKAKSGYVFYDRYHGDLLVDPHRYRYGGPMWLARLWSRTLPQPDHLIYLDAEVDVLLARKQEISADALTKNRKGYQELVERQQGTVVNVDRKLGKIVDEVLLLINVTRKEASQIDHG